MTDAEFAALKARVRALADKWIGPLGLKWWRVELDFDRAGFERSEEMRAGNQFCLMRCYVMWQYLTATIEVNAPECAELTDERLEETFVHELAHIFLHEMRAIGERREGWLDHEERVATQLGRAFIWLREGAEREFRGRLEKAEAGRGD